MTHNEVLQSLQQIQLTKLTTEQFFLKHILKYTNFILNLQILSDTAPFALLYLTYHKGHKADQ